MSPKIASLSLTQMVTKSEPAALSSQPLNRLERPRSRPEYRRNLWPLLRPLFSVASYYEPSPAARTPSSAPGLTNALVSPGSRPR